jgi:hypothetical protein
MPFWRPKKETLPKAEEPAPKPSGHDAEIERLEAFVKSKTNDRASLSKKAQRLEADIKVKQGEISRTLSPTDRDFHGDELNDLLDEIEGVRAEAEQINIAIRPSRQLITELRKLKVHQETPVSAEKIDGAHAQLERIIELRRESDEAMKELLLTQKSASTAQVNNRPAPIPTAAAPLADTPDARQKEQRERLRRLNLLQDE